MTGPFLFPPVSKTRRILDTLDLGSEEFRREGAAIIRAQVALEKLKMGAPMQHTDIRFLADALDIASDYHLTAADLSR